MSTYTTPASSRHASYARQPSTYSSRQIPSAQSGFLSYSANHRNVIPPRPLSLRPISQATSIAIDSDYESYSDSVSKRERGRSMAGSRGWRQGDIKEEAEDHGTSTEEVSDAESMESLSSRARHMAGILSDSDSMHSRARTSISSFSEAATPEASPLPHCGEPAIYDPDQKNPMMFRHSISFSEDLPRYSVKEAMATTIGPRGPHLFRSLSVQAGPNNTNTRSLASTADFIPPTPITPVDVTEFQLPPFPPMGMSKQEAAAPPPLPQFKSQLSPISQAPPTPSLLTPSLSTPSLPEERSFNPERDIRPISMISAAVINDYDNLDISHWTPQQVCSHFLRVGFDKNIVEKFEKNDISGQILVDLKWEDLKELDIQSFGKRIELWSEIHHLRSRANSGPVEQFARRPESKMSRTASYRSARPSPATSRPPMTPKTPHIEALKPIAFTPDLAEEDEEGLAPRESSDDEETTIAVRVVRNPTRRRRVGSRRGTHARVSRRHFATDSATEAQETEEERTVVYRSDNQSLPLVNESKKGRRKNPGVTDLILPGDSISVVGSRRTCKAHKNATKCKKGDKCGVHGKGARHMHLKQLERSESTSGTILIAATPSIADKMSLPRLSATSILPPETRPESVVAPSVLASSDVLGPHQAREVKLQEEALKDIVLMDPAENVKKFLIHQHLQQLQERRNAPTGPQGDGEEGANASYNVYPDPNAPTPVSPRMPPIEDYGEEEEEEAEKQSTIGPLVIPQGPAEIPAPMSPVNRTKTPALGLRTTNLTPAPPSSAGFSPIAYRSRVGSMLRTTTPFSEMDVPVSTGTPMVPEFRNLSASVPPDMTYGIRQRPQVSRASFNGGSTAGRLMAPAPPPPGAAGISRRGAQSTTGVRPQGQVMTSLDENAEWEDVPSAGDKVVAKGRIIAQVSTAGGVNPSMRVHSGWMRKRKTHWFKHEWPEHHFVLRGTRLGIHKDQHSAEEGFIEMDDYQVACSNSNSTKLSAAFKSWKIKNGQGNLGEGAFFFQLVPCSEKERKAKGIISSSDKKVHHFAVKSRDERIDWMRELMLAKAIKQKGQGYTVEVNGEKV